MFPYLLYIGFNHPFPCITHIFLIVYPYTLEYQDHDPDILDHKILLYRVSIVFPFNPLHPNKIVNKGFFRIYISIIILILGHID